MMIKAITTTSIAAAAGSVLGAITNEQALTWVGVAVAVISAFITAGLAGFHKIREASRVENIADLASQTEGLTRYITAQLEVERRVTENAKNLSLCEQRLATLDERVKEDRGTNLATREAAVKIAIDTNAGDTSQHPAVDVRS